MNFIRTVKQTLIEGSQNEPRTSVFSVVGPTMTRAIIADQPPIKVTHKTKARIFNSRKRRQKVWIAIT